MSENKSIDGLATRGAKNQASSSKRPKNKGKSIKITEVTEEIDDAIINDTVNEQDLKDALTESIELTSTEQAVEDFLKPVQAFNFDSDTGKLTAEPVKKDDKMKSSDAKNQEVKSTKKSKKDSSNKDKKKPGKVRKIITSIILIIVLAIIGLTLWAVFWGNDIIAKITGGQGNVLDLISLMNETYEPLKTDSNGRTNILAFGTSGYDMSGNTDDGTHDGAQLTDSIMMISLNQETGDIVMLSLPRDLKVPGGCFAGKINEVYFCNNENGNNEAAGAAALMNEVGNVLGVDFQYYAHLNWGSLVSIVDTLGGITVVLDEDIADYGWTDAVYEAGVEYTINGEEALGLARARHGTLGGDFTRGTSQQKILIGIKNRIFEKNLSIADMLSLASTLGDNLRTNFSIQDLKTFAHLTFEFDFDTIRQITLIDYINNVYYMTTATINDISYVIPVAGEGNYGEIQKYVLEQLLWTPPEPEEESEEEPEINSETESENKTE